MRVLSILVAAIAISCQTAHAAGPAYTSEGIVNASDYTPGPFAPNSVISIFGTNLAWDIGQIGEAEANSRTLPTYLAGVRVYVDNDLVGLFYVSPGQINFLMPPDLTPGPATIRVVREGQPGPLCMVTLLEAAPALFSLPAPWPAGFAIAQQWPEYSRIAPESRTAPGRIIILYATGLGPTAESTVNRYEIPYYPWALLHLSTLKVYLNGAPLDSEHILWAGLSPGCAGLYQVNIKLPDDVGDDPELRIGFGDQLTASGLKLPLTASPAQPK
jgi:uncharacterized protein (TIGR03437 family)